jgi:hemerythrin superfamily protein
MTRSNMRALPRESGLGLAAERAIALAGTSNACVLSMNAIDLLKQQHREVEQLFARLEKTDDVSGRAGLFRELASKLVAHDGIEREIFYPACEEKMGLSDELGEALVEHGVIEFSLYECDQALKDDDFKFKVTVLKELVEHHVKEEEQEFLPQVEKAFDGEELDELAEELEDAFEDAVSEDYHEPLFENLRQVLAGTLKPAPADEDAADDEEDERPSTKQRRTRGRRSA